MTKRRFSLALAAGAVLTLSACDDPGPTGTGPDGQVAALSVAAHDTVLVAGATVQLRAEASDASGRGVAGAQVAWSSSDTLVAQVSAAGLVSARGAGEATLTARSGSATAGTRVAVRAADADLWASISTSGGFSCGLAATPGPEGTNVYCWGYGASGELGAAPTPDACTVGGGSNCARVPTPITSGLRLAGAASGIHHSCGVSAEGAAYCWGVPGFQPAGGSSVTATSATPVTGGLSFASAVAGGVHSCGITRGGEAFCWGVNASGQLGTAETLDTCRYPISRFETYPYPCTGRPVRVAVPEKVVQLALGADHACALGESGAAYCWGDAASGQLGTGATARDTCDFRWGAPRPEAYPCERRPVAVSGGLKFQSLSAGGNSTCGVTTAGEARCWGSSNWLRSTTPAAVFGGRKVRTISTAEDHACILTPEGRAHCTGSNFYGQLGDGTTADRVAPVEVATALTFVSLDVGGFTTCGISRSGMAYCWGSNFWGGLGTRETLEACGTGALQHPCSPRPIPVSPRRRGSV